MDMVECDGTNSNSSSSSIGSGGGDGGGAAGSHTCIKKIGQPCAPELYCSVITNIRTAAGTKCCSRAQDVWLSMPREGCPNWYTWNRFDIKSIQPRTGKHGL
ncbi:hypothetical protein HZH66_003076 [Vespula vulgaris]|uniref:Uncharacterized protein n=1 Tax=Vespula vulgaris TaxID=7454 RepID=A0A836XN18_VESVU|nr:hypothetical protein HZH66_003076 [Vespula vulgaris]